MQAIYTSRYTAFSGARLVARGSYAEITQGLATLDRPGETVLVFDDVTGAAVDAPPRPEHAARLAQLNTQAAAAPPRPAPGRPRLGVVAREVTLLPRHWEWLATQPGGASATLRRLVEHARKGTEAGAERRRASERTYTFINAIAGNQPGFEEAVRALFASDRARFEALIAAWPTDVAAHARELALPVWPAATEGSARP